MTTLKCGFITLLGLPNAGKSSILNMLVGETLAIVTPKAQTTRQIMRGFVVRPGIQLIVTDTPGLQEGTTALNQALTRNAARALKSARKEQEAVAFVVDSIETLKRIEHGKATGFENLAALLETHCGHLPLRLSLIPLFNKADIVKSEAGRKKVETFLLPLLKQTFSYVEEPLWISARTQMGMDDFLKRTEKYLRPATEDLFAPDELTDQPLREFAAEFVREQCFMQLGAEIPYSIAVEIEEFNEKDPALTKVRAVLHIERESQKAIVIGQGGSKIKNIGIKSREKLEQFLGTKVFIGLKVKVSPKWARNETLVEKFGYGGTQ